MRSLPAFALVLVLLAVAPMRAQQPPQPAAATQVLATLTVNADADRPAIMKVMPQEVRDTVKLYLDGKIQQWYSRADGRGVVFILNVTSIADAKALTGALPLVKANLVTFDYMPLAPLAPLRLLLQP
jgi:hypothetical protein